MAGLKRSARVMKKKELAEGRPEDESLILSLKRELDDLRKVEKEQERIHTRHLGLHGEDVMPSEDEDEVEVKRKKVVRDEVPQQVIDFLKLKPFNRARDIPEHKLANRSKSYRDFFYASKALDEKYWEYEKALIHQFDNKGYAIDYSYADDEEKT